VVLEDRSTNCSGLTGIGRRHTDQSAVRSNPAWICPPAAHRTHAARRVPCATDGLVVVESPQRRAKPAWEQAGDEITPIRVARLLPPMSRAFHESEPGLAVRVRMLPPKYLARSGVGQATRRHFLVRQAALYAPPVDAFTAVENRGHAISDPERYGRMDGSPSIAAATHDDPRLSR
jgi:hypothetical protein